MPFFHCWQHAFSTFVLQAVDMYAMYYGGMPHLFGTDNSKIVKNLTQQKNSPLCGTPLFLQGCTCGPDFLLPAGRVAWPAGLVLALRCTCQYKRRGIRDWGIGLPSTLCQHSCCFSPKHEIVLMSDCPADIFCTG